MGLSHPNNPDGERNVQTHGKLYGILSIPGWVAILIELLHFVEDVSFIQEKFPALVSFLKQLPLPHLDPVALILTIIYLFSILFIVPSLSRKIGLGKSIALILFLIAIAAGIIGFMRGNKAIEEENRKYHERQAAKP
ncbi:hypothetical protein DYQ86_22225 [Acidobacteria bacterium AB60]|nr:hypothetical protein DYQ86_22225 [Acidobacteria bacterium AB60]